ncbi:MAG: hypothetical protein Fur0037_00060 [Planctomycetota bacterium]
MISGMRPLLFLAAIPFLLVPLPAQSPAKLKAELRKMEAAAKRDPDALFKAGKWAQDKGLTMDARRIFKAVLKIDPNHEGANTALGNRLYEGKWLPEKEVEELRKKAMRAEYQAKGWVEVDGVFVPPDEVQDAKKGIFHHGSEIVSRAEKLEFLAGARRHPITGEIVPAAEIEQAGKGLFKIAAGKWVPAEEANRFHQNPEHPWLYRTNYFTLVSTLSLDTLDKVKLSVDQAYETVSRFLGGVAPKPNHRPGIFVAATRDEYMSLGQSIGDETSAYGAFLCAERARLKLPFQDEVRAAACNWAEKGWGEYYAMHAAGLAYLSSLLQDIGGEVPLWFEHAFGSYASRFPNSTISGFFGELHIQKGGVRNLKSWFHSYGINGEMESKDIDYNIYQAGLMLAYATSGADPKVTDAMLAITKRFADGKGQGLDKDVSRLEDLLVAHEKDIQAFLQKLAANKDR